MGIEYLFTIVLPLVQSEYYKLLAAKIYQLQKAKEKNNTAGPQGVAMVPNMHNAPGNVPVCNGRLLLFGL